MIGPPDLDRERCGMERARQTVDEEANAMFDRLAALYRAALRDAAEA